MNTEYRRKKDRKEKKKRDGVIDPICIVSWMYYNVLQCVAVCCGVCRMWQQVAVCCGVLQCVAACCIVLQSPVALYLQYIEKCAVRWTVLKRVTVCCSMLQCFAVCCSTLQILLRRVFDML